MDRRGFLKLVVFGWIGLVLNVKGNIPKSTTEENLGGYLVPQRYVDQLQMAFAANKVIVSKPVKITQLGTVEFGNWINGVDGIYGA